MLLITNIKLEKEWDKSTSELQNHFKVQDKLGVSRPVHNTSDRNVSNKWENVCICPLMYANVRQCRLKSENVCSIVPMLIVKRDCLLIRLNRLSNEHMFFGLNKFKYRLTSMNVCLCMKMSSYVGRHLVMSDDVCNVYRHCLHCRARWISLKDRGLMRLNESEIGFYRKWPREESVGKAFLGQTTRGWIA